MSASTSTSNNYDPASRLEDLQENHHLQVIDSILDDVDPVTNAQQEVLFNPHTYGLHLINSVDDMVHLDYASLPPYPFPDAEEIREWLKSNHSHLFPPFPNGVHPPNTNHLKLLIAAIIHVPTFRNYSTPPLTQEIDWKVEITSLIQNVVHAANQGQRSLDGRYEVPVQFSSEYYAIREHTARFGFNPIVGTRVDISIGLSVPDFPIYERERGCVVPVTQFYQQQVQKDIYVSLETSTLRKSILPFFHLEVKGFTPDGIPDGRPQAYTAMIASLTLFNYIRNLASIRSPLEFAEWKSSSQTTHEDEIMSRRCYGCVAHSENWELFVMILHFDEDGQLGFIVKPIWKGNVTTVDQLHRFNEILCRILREGSSRKATMQQWISLATAGLELPKNIIQLRNQTPPSSADRSDRTYLSPNSPPHSTGGGGGGERRRSPRLNPRQTTTIEAGPSSRSRNRSYLDFELEDNRKVPWTKLLDPAEEKVLAKKWWNTIGRTQMSGGHHVPEMRERESAPLPSPPISPLFADTNAKHDNETHD